MEETLMPVRLHGEILVKAPDGRNHAMRVHRLSDYPTANPKPYCAGCSQFYESEQSLADAHAEGGSAPRGVGAHAFAFVDLEHQHLGPQYSAGIALIPCPHEPG